MKTTNNKSGLIGTAVVLVILLAACIAVDAALPSYHIAITVIKKATVYSLVAVSMNLLNGFTGLFSLGQAGFMLLGAYSYAILTIPVAKRAGVYQYFDGGWVHFSLPEIFSGALVFVDCYTTWCGPCKMMTEEVFPQKEAGDFFNAHFVNVKFDMEKGEGKELSKQFKIRAYPTFLLLNPENRRPAD